MSKKSIKNFDPIIKKVKKKVSNILIKQFQELENNGKHIIDIDENDRTISLDHLKEHVYSKLKKGDIELNVTDLSKGRFQISLPHIDATEFDHLYVLPEVREMVIDSLSDKEIKVLEVNSLLELKKIEEKNLKMAEEFSMSGTSASKHRKVIQEIDQQLEELI